ncbi:MULTISPECIES: ornithine cyclodeaminase family protein [unclassified Enterococcus]|uniref:ornithine cyclodeaminase family protein n=1 Tax=unclassified Enterococcus TaxID=2608891 RepID=UPI001554F76A|nr:MULTISPECIES: ornithine cyclodeaminase family protein [unclassified Enterococcus]MBS7575940.1 ornithine cyclodeaminase family protein [Enterococcus sp. MMGLQ5-2]MBS7583173.1 ornithine cyclodeaminase family protein [Enterococcus sp. MMGLQ5-1]NPD11033.1 ornithine cyclodeaminase family protein [Enterococcus sp. MMGLQ5-1]NPD35776.1 ornithine cyclodeaminase family protein [Enterococcus sp. MMGLQ5-2]
MKKLTEEEICRFYSMDDCILAVSDAFRYFSAGKIQLPLRTKISEAATEGTYLCMPASCEAYNAACVKILNVFPRNAQKQLPTIHAEVILINTTTGQFEMMLDGNYITQIRTGAATGVAFDLLANKTCQIGALIGTGGQAAAQLEAMLTVRKLAEIRIFSQNSQKTAVFIEKMQPLAQKYHCQLIQSKSGNDAVTAADLIVTVTSSMTPVYDADKIKKGATISAVGSYLPEMQETPSELFERIDKIYFDSKEAVLAESGDLLVPIQKKIISKKDFNGDIGQVILGEIAGRTSEDEIIFFKTVGIAAQDLITAKSIYNQYQNQ